MGFMRRLLPLALLVGCALPARAEYTAYSELRQDNPVINEVIGELSSSDMHGTLNRISALFTRGPVRDLAGGAIVSVGPGVELDRGIDLTGRCSIAMAARIGEGSSLANSVVLEESWIGPRCRLDRVIVGPNTELPAGFEASNAIVCSDLAPESELQDGIVRRDGLLFRPFTG